MGIMLSLAMTAKYFDKFIPHVHPIHIIALLIGISLLRFYPSIIFLTSYVIMKNAIFGVEGPTIVASAIHIAQPFSLLLILLIRLKMFKDKNKPIQILIMSAIIIMTLSLYLFIMIMADSEYTRVTDTSVPFWERVRLALIYPGDWMNVTVSAAMSVAIVPIVYTIFKPMVDTLTQQKY